MTDVATILLKVVIWLLVFDIYNSSKTKYFDTCYERLYLYVIPINLHHLLFASFAADQFVYFEILNLLTVAVKE